MLKKMSTVGPNNIWARPTCSWGVQRPKPKRLWPGDAAEDSLVLGRPKAPLRRGKKEV